MAILEDYYFRMRYPNGLGGADDEVGGVLVGCMLDLNHNKSEWSGQGRRMYYPQIPVEVGHKDAKEYVVVCAQDNDTPPE